MAITTSDDSKFHGVIYALRYPREAVGFLNRCPEANWGWMRANKLQFHPSKMEMPGCENGVIRMGAFEDDSETSASAKCGCPNVYGC